MKTFKIFAIIAIASAVFVSCSKDGYWEEGNPSADGIKYTFDKKTLDFTFTPYDSVSQVLVNVARNSAEGAFELPIVTTTNDANISFPDTVVRFADGQLISTFAVNLKEDIAIGESTSLTLEFDSTAYANSSSVFQTSVKIGKEYTYTTLGTAQFTDFFMFSDIYEAELQQSDQNPNVYRLVDPYSAPLKAEEYDTQNGPDPYLKFQILHPGDVIRGTEVTQEGLVYFPDFATGDFEKSYNDEVIMLHPSRFTSMSDESYWLCNRVMQSNEDGTPEIVQLAPYYYMFSVGGWNYTQYDGVVTIYFPNVPIYDFDVEVTYDGRQYDAADNQVILSTISWGSDIAYVRAKLCTEEESNYVQEAIISGKDDNAVKLTESGKQVQFDMVYEENGKYSIVVVGYDAEDNVQNLASTTFKYTGAPGGEAEETFTPQFIGTYQYTQFFANEDGSPYDDEGLVLSVSDSDPNKYRISNVFYGVDFDFVMNPEDGTISFEEQSTGYIAGDIEVLVEDMYAVAPDQFEPSHYENGVFYFSIGYYATGGYGWQGYGTETFTLTANYSGAKTNKSYLVSPWMKNWNKNNKFNSKLKPVKLGKMSIEK